MNKECIRLLFMEDSKKSIKPRDYRNDLKLYFKD